VPLRKSAAKVRATAARTAGSEMIRPSSRLSFSEVPEKFSEPMKILACPVP
jgi:hypothetical protein